MKSRFGLTSTLWFQISVLYTGKLKDNDEVFESNVGDAPFKFRLGTASLRSIVLFMHD